MHRLNITIVTTLHSMTTQNAQLKKCHYIHICKITAEKARPSSLCYTPMTIQVAISKLKLPVVEDIAFAVPIYGYIISQYSIFIHNHENSTIRNRHICMPAYYNNNNKLLYTIQSMDKSELWHYSILYQMHSFSHHVHATHIAVHTPAIREKKIVLRPK